MALFYQKSALQSAIVKRLFLTQSYRFDAEVAEFVVALFPVGHEGIVNSDITLYGNGGHRKSSGSFSFERIIRVRSIKGLISFWTVAQTNS